LAEESDCCGVWNEEAQVSSTSRFLRLEEKGLMIDSKCYMLELSVGLRTDSSILE